MEERIGSLLRRVPGYTSYRQKEERRDDDKRVRVAIADDLGNLVDALSRRNAALVEARELSQISRIERLIGQIRLLADRVRTATYGYGGIFTENSVDESVLDQIRQFDLAFQRETDELSSIVGRISDAAATPAESDLDAVQTEIARLGLLVDGRAQVVQTARPHQDAEVLSLLETNAPPEPSPLLSVGLGDTFSVLGDNYRADAIVTFVDGDIRILLARVGEDDHALPRWFLASSTPEISTASLVERGGESELTLTMKSAAANVQSAKGKREGVPAQYAYAADDVADGGVSFGYIIGDETRHMSGRKVNDMDIELYGAAQS